MRTIEIKSIQTGKVVARGHFWSFDQFQEMQNLPSGDYLIQGTNSMSCRPRISAKHWGLAKKFTIPEK